MFNIYNFIVLNYLCVTKKLCVMKNLEKLTKDQLLEMLSDYFILSEKKKAIGECKLSIGTYEENIHFMNECTFKMNSIALHLEELIKK